MFTDDVLIEGLAATTRGIAAKVALWTSDEGIKTHPIAHQITNPVVTEEPDGTVRLTSKGIMVRADRPPTSIVCEDIAVRTGSGWRIAHRRVINRNRQAAERGEVW